MNQCEFSRVLITTVRLDAVYTHYIRQEVQLCSNRAECLTDVKVCIWHNAQQQMSTRDRQRPADGRLERRVQSAGRREAWVVGCK